MSTRKPDWMLPAAAALGALEATMLIAVIIFAGHRRPGWAVFMALKYPFCLQLLRRRAGAFFAILLWEVSGVALAVTAPHVAIVLRALEVAMAGGVLALLLASAHLFPSPELPSP